jgi:lysophosphatidate acyltransferase
MFAALVCVLVSPIAILFRQTSRLNLVMGTVFCFFCEYILGLQLEISSFHIPEVWKPAVLVMNHQSELDAYIVAKFFRKNVTVVGKRELLFIPFFGIWLWLGNNILLRRKNKEEAHKMFDEAALKMKKEEVSNRSFFRLYIHLAHVFLFGSICQLSVIIFPEGTRSYSDKPVLLPFKKGAFHLAVKSGCPIIPIVTENYAKTGIFDTKKKLFGKGTVKVRGEID